MKLPTPPTFMVTNLTTQANMFDWYLRNWLPGHFFETDF